MSTMLDRMRAIMDKNGVKANQVTTMLGISNSSFTDWRKGKGTPSVLVLARFAELFNESLDYIISGKTYTTNTVSTFNKKEQELLDKFNQLTPEDKTKSIGYIDGMLASTSSNENGEKRLSI